MRALPRRARGTSGSEAEPTTSTLPAAPTVELGGEWTGPGQTEVQALASRIGVSTFPTYANGHSLYYRSGRLSTYASALPPTSPESAAELLQMISALNLMAKDVPADEPRKAPAAAAYDAQTVGSWIAAHG